jgi:hypothetical protein
MYKHKQIHLPFHFDSIYMVYKYSYERMFIIIRFKMKPPEKVLAYSNSISYSTSKQISPVSFQ